MKTAGLMFLMATLAAITTAQELNTIQSADTLGLRRLVFPGPKNSLGRLSFLPPTRLSAAAIARDFPTSFLGYALLSDPPEKRVDLFWQMSLSRKDEDPLGSIRIMLGAVEAGGVAYLAYRHIRKYGFLK